MRLLASLCLIAALASPVMAGNWPNWRGPDQNGVATGSGFPTEWSETKNVAWKIELPGKGSSTPVVWGEQIFLTSGADGQNVLLSLNRQGKEQWRVLVGKERPGKSKKASGSNPSCVTDGEHVFAYFKSGDLACVDFKGQIVWQTNLQDKYGEDTLWWDLGTSPVLTKAHCVVTVMQTGPSYLVAFEKATGKVIWKEDRNLGAPEEAAQSYSTPVVLSEKGKETLVVLGADHVTAHERTTDRIFVTSGLVRIALYDGRVGSRTRGMINEFRFGTVRPALIVVPPQVWHGLRLHLDVLPHEPVIAMTWGFTARSRASAFC